MPYFYHCQSCLSCPANAIELDQIPWASWVAIMKYNLSVILEWIRNEGVVMRVCTVQIPIVTVSYNTLFQALCWRVHSSRLLPSTRADSNVQPFMQCSNLFCNFWLTPNYMIWYSFYSIFTASGLIFIARSSDIHPLQIFQYFQHRVCSSAFMVYT